jgi:hypothetical protein
MRDTRIFLPKFYICRPNFSVVCGRRSRFGNKNNYNKNNKSGMKVGWLRSDREKLELDEKFKLVEVKFSFCRCN